jgi:hypothetical protein
MVILRAKRTFCETINFEATTDPWKQNKIEQNSILEFDSPKWNASQLKKCIYL